MRRVFICPPDVSEMPESAIIFTKKAHVVQLMLNRPDAQNGINQQLAQELEAACLRINQDDGIYVVILTGAGGSFCGGGEPDGGEMLWRPAAAIASIECPVIAAINGDTLGHGLELALSCDVRVAAETARFGLPQLAMGKLPSDGGTQRLPRIVGRGKALEMVLTAEVIDAGEALEIGLVNRVVPAGQLMSEVTSLAEAMAGRAPIALRYAKEAVLKGLDLTLEQGLRLEADLYFLLQTTADRREGIRSFLEKKHPRFQGR